MSDMKAVTFKLEPVKVLSRKKNDFGYGLKRKRDITLREAKYIMKDIFGIDISDRDCFETAYEYKDFNDELRKTVQMWLDGEVDDFALMEYAFDCSDEPLGVFNAFRLAEYLQKKGII